MREYPLVNTTDSLYPRITPVKYPKVGERNAACRIGVVSAAGGRRHWLPLDGIPASTMSPIWSGQTRMSWSFNSSTGSRTPSTCSEPCRRMRRRDVVTRSSSDHDDAWLDLQDVLPWVHRTAGRTGSSGSASATAGGTSTRPACPAARPTAITPGDFDVIQIAGIDQKSGHGLLHGIAGERHAEIPLSRRARRQGPRAGDARGSARDARLRGLARRPLGGPPLFRRQHAAARRTDPPAGPRTGQAVHG